MKSVCIAIILMFSSMDLHTATDPKPESIKTDTCLPENQDNKSVVDEAITDPVWADIWVQNNITGVTPQNIEYVSSNDPKCQSLLTNYNQSIIEVHPNTTFLMYTVTFHKYGNNYFVLKHINQHPGRVTYGSSPLYILDQNLNFIVGLAL